MSELHKLVEKWREEAALGIGFHNDRLRQCAVELEAALAGGDERAYTTAYAEQQ